MIAHLGMELALRETNGDRPAARTLVREGIIRQAELEAKLACLSIKCRIGRHADPVAYGCYNDGSTCLCECHDPSPRIPRGER